MPVFNFNWNQPPDGGAPLKKGAFPLYGRCCKNLKDGIAAVLQDATLRLYPLKCIDAWKIFVFPRKNAIIKSKVQGVLIMDKNLIAIVGMCGAGKSELTDLFVKAGFFRIQFQANLTMDEIKPSRTRGKLRKTKNIFGKIYAPVWVNPLTLNWRQ